MVIAPNKNASQMNHRLQIVRFTGDVEKTTEGLFDFLREKKFDIPKDDTLLLLVWLEKALKLNYIELGQKLGQANVPYGQIFLVGKTKRNKSKIFFSLEVYPKIRSWHLDLSFLENQKPA
jgi:hypothetical protein